jgi:dienelactone hydrolase
MPHLHAVVPPQVGTCDIATWGPVAIYAGTALVIIDSGTLDVLTDAVHGYAPPGTERYNRDASELHWERVHAMFRRNLPRD